MRIAPPKSHSRAYPPVGALELGTKITSPAHTHLLSSHGFNIDRRNGIRRDRRDRYYRCAFNSSIDQRSHLKIGEEELTKTLASPRLAYMAYFDYQRRKSPEFRRHLRRNERRQARAEKEEAEASTHRQREAIKSRVDEAKETGFPAGVEEREAFFNEQVMAGEMLSSDRTFPGPAVTEL